MTDNGAWRSSPGRLMIAAAAGLVAAVVAFVLGIPGNGEFVPTTWAAGFVAQLVLPGWAGFAALVGSIAASAGALDLSDGSFDLVVLIVAVLGAIAAHGALAAAVIARLRAIGWTRAVHDERFLAGAGVALGIVVVFAWFAVELGRNPP